MPDHLLETRQGLSRRAVVTGLAAVAGAVALAPMVVPETALAQAIGAANAPAAGTAEPEIASLLRLSSRLTGIELDLTWSRTARLVWWQAVQQTSLAGMVQMAEVIEHNQAATDDALAAALEAVGLWPTAQAFNQLWYTGMVTGVGQTSTNATNVLFYDEALAWAACTFTKPAATCGGETNYWQFLPAGGEIGR